MDGSALGDTPTSPGVTVTDWILGSCGSESEDKSCYCNATACDRCVRSALIIIAMETPSLYWRRQLSFPWSSNHYSWCHSRPERCSPDEAWGHAEEDRWDLTDQTTEAEPAAIGSAPAWYGTWSLQTSPSPGSSRTSKPWLQSSSNCGHDLSRNAVIHQLYLPKSSGGLHLTSISSTLNTTRCGLAASQMCMLSGLHRAPHCHSPFSYIIAFRCSQERQRNPGPSTALLLG